VHHVDAALSDELRGDAARAYAEERIRGAAIDHGRAAAAGERECAVRNRYERQARVDRVGAWLRGRTSRNQRDLDAGVSEISHEIVDVTFQTAVPVKRKHRTRDDGDAEGIRPHEGMPAVARTLV
jgi:hypothetical protein